MNTNTEIKNHTERKQQRNDWRYCGDSVDIDLYCAEISDLRAEVERLQAALAKSQKADAKKLGELALARAALAEHEAKQVQGELPPTKFCLWYNNPPDAPFNTDGAGYSAMQMRDHYSAGYAAGAAALAQRVGCGEPVAFPELPTYIWNHPVLGEMWDRIAMHQYAMKYAMLHTIPPAAVTDADKRDAGRLDFVIENSGFIVWSLRDSTIKQCQLWTQDEDENHIILSGDERYFNTVRAAIDAAIAASEQEGR